MRLIINADDFGMARSINNAIIELANFGTISSTTVMVNMPYAEEIVRIFDNCSISIGLHLNLTQGKPVSNPESIPSLVNASGFFLSKITLMQKVAQNEIEYSEIKKEVWAQYYKLKKLIKGRVIHFDSHQGSTRINGVVNSLIELAKNENIKPTIRVHSKYYLTKSGKFYNVIKPDFRNIRKLGLRRILSEYYFRKIRNEWRYNFSTTDGMLFNNSNKTISILRDLLLVNSTINDDGIYEISCHPSTSTADLFDTEMIDVRLQEYDILKSEDFKKSLRYFELVNYNCLLQR